MQNTIPNPCRFLLIIMVMIIFTACKKNKENSVITPPAATCNLEKINYFDTGGGAGDSAIITYSNNLITQVSIGQDYFTVQYNSTNRIIKKDHFLPAQSLPFEYDTVYYNTDGSINKIETYTLFGRTSLGYITEFTFTGGQLTKMIKKVDHTGSGIPTKDYEYTFTYTGNNISQVIVAYFFDMSQPPDSVTINYNYDSNNNYLRTVNDQILLLDENFTNIDIMIPFLYSNNNVASETTVGGSTYNYSYTLNDQGKLTEIKSNGLSAIRYSYHCD